MYQTLASLARERDVAIEPVLRYHTGALDARSGGDDDTLYRLCAEAAASLSHCDSVLLAQFLMTGAYDAAKAATGLSVFTGPDGSVSRLLQLAT